MCARSDEPFYPIRTHRNMELYQAYQEQALRLSDRIVFGGRLGCYSYLDMDKSVAHALETIRGMRLSAGNLPHQKNLDFL